MADDDLEQGGGGLRLPPKLVAAILVALLGAAFILQNQQQATIELLLWELEIGLWFGLAVAFGLGLVVGWLLRRSRD
jgi:uncharacterized membrane protein YciS (DUF1049 family)